MDGGGDNVDGTTRTTPSQAVIEAVANAEDVRPEELRPPKYEPLHAVIDPEALDTIFASRSSGVPRAGGDVSFTFCGYHVTVDQRGTVALEQATSSRE